MAWVKTDPVKLLTFQHKVFRSNHKYKVHAKNNEDKWILTIRNVQPSDAGGYMCQINTNPMMAQIAFLHLKGTIGPGKRNLGICPHVCLLSFSGFDAKTNLSGRLSAEINESQ